MPSTKDKILTEALSLFSQKGFEAVSTSDIAGKLGLTKGALYRHFESKRKIFEAILQKMEAEDAEAAKRFSLPEKDIGSAPEEYARASVRALLDFTRHQFDFWTRDSFAVKFRRMLAIERFRSKASEEMFQQYLGAGPFSYTADIFRSLGFRAPKKLALDYFAPLFFLYGLSDNASTKSEAQELFDSHIHEMEKILDEQMQNSK